MARVLVIADTHVADWAALPPAIARQVAGADWVVHCGDFTGPALLEELERRSRNLCAVFGNTDGAAIRRRLPEKLVLDIAGRRVCITHPSWGGPPWGLEDEIMGVFPRSDIILYGHTHEPCQRWHNHTLLLNPGQGYSTFGFPATYALLSVEADSIEAEILQA